MLFQKMEICRHFVFSRGQGMTTDCGAIGIPNCELGETGLDSEKHERG